MTRTKQDLAAIAEKLGMKTTEITRITDSPVGTVIVTFDGVAMIDVPETNPDGAGRSGLMLLAVPGNGGYALPVFTGAIDDDELEELDIDADDRENALKSATHASNINRDDDTAPREPSKDEVASVQSELDALHAGDPDVQAQVEATAAAPKASPAKPRRAGRAAKATKAAKKR